MKVAFIVGPYRADTINGTVENIKEAEEWAKKYWQKGYCVICPHKNTALFDGLCDDSVWLAGAKELLSRSDVVILTPGWDDSPGSREEYELAKNLGKEIIIES